MDSFDAKMTLGKLLAQLQPYRPACMEICVFLLKNSSLLEELYPVILETLRKVNLNVRLNILQFVDDLVTCVKEDAKFEALKAYSFLIVRDLRSILELVIPKGESETRSLQGSSDFGTFGLSNPSKSSLYFRPLANLPPVYEILNHISILFNFTNLQKYREQYASKLLLDADKKNLALRKPFDDESIYANGEPSSLKDIETDYDVNTGLDSAWDFFIFKKRQSQYERLMIDLHDDPFSEKEQLNKNSKSDGVNSMPEENNSSNNSSTDVGNITGAADASEPLFNYSQKQLLERIENDRERQKRGKESLWKQARPNDKINIDEFNLILSKSNNWLSDKSDLLIIKDMNSMWIDSKINVSIPNEQRGRHSQQHQQQHQQQQQQQQQQHQYHRQQQQQQHRMQQQQLRNQQNWNQHPPYDYYNDDYNYQYRQPHNNRNYKTNNGPPSYDKKRPAAKAQSSTPQKRKIYNKEGTNKRQHNK